MLYEVITPDKLGNGLPGCEHTLGNSLGKGAGKGIVVSHVISTCLYCDLIAQRVISLRP